MTSTSATPAGSHQDLGRGAAGTALARIAAARLTGLPPRATAPWIRAMTAGPVTANASASLFYGAPAVAFVLHTGAHPAYAAMLAALDEHVNDLTALKLAAAYERIDRGELARPGEYDLISGLTGLGVYHLVRHGSAGSGMTAAVLDYLVALAEPVRRHGESLPGWWSGTGPAGTPDPAWPGGHLNLGMAHGIAGILALLSGAMRVGIQVEGHAKAVSELCATFDRYRQGSSACPWWPAMISLSEHSQRDGELQNARPGPPGATAPPARRGHSSSRASRSATRSGCASPSAPWPGASLTGRSPAFSPTPRCATGGPAWSRRSGGPPATPSTPGRSRPRCARHDGAWKTTSPAQARQPPAGSWKEHPASSSPRTTCPARAANRPHGTPACC